MAKFTKSKADIDKQISRIYAAHKDHRLYDKAQGLAIRYNYNMSESAVNSDLHHQYMACLYPSGIVRPTDKEKADALLDQMANHQYSRDVYSRGPELKVPQTRVYTNVDKGDWVHCTFCDSNMLLPGGADKCPECGSVGRLVWADEFYPESAKSSLDNKYYTNRKLLAKAVYSDDTLQADFPQVWERIKQGEQVFV